MPRRFNPVIDDRRNNHRAEGAQKQADDRRRRKQRRASEGSYLASREYQQGKAMAFFEKFFRRSPDE